MLSYGRKQCAKSMENKLASRSDFEIDIFNNLINLLKALKEHSLNFQETRYKMSIISDALKSLVSTRQKDNENLQDYTRHFRTSKEIFESHVGCPIILKIYILTMDEYKKTEKEASKNHTEINFYDEKWIRMASDRMYAFLYLENSDPQKYGSVLKSLSQQKSFGNNQYPKNITNANNILSNHRFDNSSEKIIVTSNKKGNKDEKNINDDQKDEELQDILSFTQMEGRCFCCGKPGHKSPQCRQRHKIPREEWAINKTQFTQAKDNESMNSNGSNSTLTTSQSSSTNKNIDKKKVGWSNVQFSFAQNNDMKQLVLLDSDSTSTIFCNKDYVNNIRPAKYPLYLNTNGGQLITTFICDIPNLGTHWFNEKAITNVISIADITKHYRVAMDTDKEKAMIIHLPDNLVKFIETENGLYARLPNYLNNKITTDSSQIFCLQNKLKELKQQGNFYITWELHQFKI